jgi:hypothetical protein
VRITPGIRTDMIGAVSWCANSSIELISRMTNLDLSRYYFEIKKNNDAVSRVKQYMNRKYKLLFDTSFGCFYWRVKARLICWLSNKVKSKKVVKSLR